MSTFVWQINKSAATFISERFSPVWRLLPSKICAVGEAHRKKVCEAFRDTWKNISGFYRGVAQLGLLRT